VQQQIFTHTERELEMTTITKQKTFFTNDFARAHPSIKVEIMIKELHRLACYYDVDDSLSFNTVVEELEHFRQVVAK
jgi:hypothetical protein